MVNQMSSITRKMGRAKVSTTVAPENYAFLEEQVVSGRARSLAHALDQSIATLRRLENRRRLAAATKSYFDSLTAKAAAEEERLAGDLASASRDIDFDQEP
jgi:hypothetical protein